MFLKFTNSHLQVFLSIVKRNLFINRCDCAYDGEKPGDKSVLVYERWQVQRFACSFNSSRRPGPQIYHCYNTLMTVSIFKPRREGGSVSAPVG